MTGHTVEARQALRQTRAMLRADAQVREYEEHQRSRSEVLIRDGTGSERWISLSELYDLLQETRLRW